MADDYQKGYEKGRKDTVAMIMAGKMMRHPRAYSHHGDGYYDAQNDLREDIRCLPNPKPRKKAVEEEKEKANTSEGSIRARVKEAMANSKYTQTQLAEQLGVSLDYIWKYSSMRHTPSTKMLVKICQVCEVSADWLLGLK